MYNIAENKNKDKAFLQSMHLSLSQLYKKKKIQLQARK